MFERSGYHFFTFRDVDVAVSPWYMLLMAFFAFGGLLRAGGGMAGDAFISGIIWVFGITISLLIHEFGHAFVSKHYGLRPSILLHGFGGLCMHEPAETDGRDALIVFAGPGVELVFGGLCALFTWFVMPQLSLSPAVGSALGQLMSVLVWFNIFWGLLNLLLPIWPLDGGQLFHLLLRRFMPEARAQDLALKVSIFVLIPVGIVGFLMLKSFFVAILALFLLMNNINALKGGHQLVARQAKVRASDFQQELFEDAEDALANGDAPEAYRLCHQLRSTGDLPAKMLDRVWEILTVTAIDMERFDEAKSYAKRAPDTAVVREARHKIDAQSA